MPTRTACRSSAATPRRREGAGRPPCRTLRRSRTRGWSEAASGQDRHDERPRTSRRRRGSRSSATPRSRSTRCGASAAAGPSSPPNGSPTASPRLAARRASRWSAVSRAIDAATRARLRGHAAMITTTRAAGSSTPASGCCSPRLRTTSAWRGCSRRSARATIGPGRMFARVPLALAAHARRLLSWNARVAPASRRATQSASRVGPATARRRAPVTMTQRHAATARSRSPACSSPGDRSRSARSDARRSSSCTATRILDRLDGAGRRGRRARARRGARHARLRRSPRRRATSPTTSAPTRSSCEGALQGARHRAGPPRGARLRRPVRPLLGPAASGRHGRA